MSKTPLFVCLNDTLCDGHVVIHSFGKRGSKRRIDIWLLSLNLITEGIYNAIQFNNVYNWSELEGSFVYREDI